MEELLDSIVMDPEIELALDWAEQLAIIKNDEREFNHETKLAYLDRYAAALKRLRLSLADYRGQIA